MVLSANEEIRRTMRANEITLWKLADRLGCHEQTLLKHLRRELPATEKQRIIGAIEELTSSNGAT